MYNGSPFIFAESTHRITTNTRDASSRLAEKGKHLSIAVKVYHTQLNSNPSTGMWRSHSCFLFFFCGRNYEVCPLPYVHIIYSLFRPRHDVLSRKGLFKSSQILCFILPPRPRKKSTIGHCHSYTRISASKKRFLIGCSLPFMRLAQHLTALRAGYKYGVPGR